MTDYTTPTTTPTTPAPDASTTPVTPAAPTSTDLPDWAKDPALAAKMVADLRAENARDRTAAKDKAAADAQADLLKRLGLKPDDQPVSPEAHQRELAARDQRIRDLTIKNALSDILSTQGAKPIARAAVIGEGILDGLDPAAADFSTTLASKVSGYLTANPELKAQAQAAGSSGTDSPGGDSPKPSFTRGQLRDPAFYQANKAAIEAAYLDGRITE